VRWASVCGSSRVRGRGWNPWWRTASAYSADRHRCGYLGDDGNVGYRADPTNEQSNRDPKHRPKKPTVRHDLILAMPIA
jgi:hypothetical protein